MTSSPRAKAFNWTDLLVRAISAIVLIPAVLLAVFWGGWLFLLMISIGVALLAIEWGIMTEPQAPTRAAIGVGVAVLVSVFAAWLDPDSISPALVLLVAGAAGAGLFARLRKTGGMDAAYGVFYVGWPSVVLVWLRQHPDGRDWTLMLFAIAWSADIAAYAIGNLFGGPRLWPRFSPNKTWSGFLGGLAAAVLAAVLVAWWRPMALGHGPRGLAFAAAIGLVAGLATMGGDLWESALKRRFGVKDAGRLIPGHGGLMDRVDGLMFAVIAVAAARLVSRFGGFL